MFQRLQRWLPPAVGGLAVIARIVPGPRVIDDAYITFRYARNLAAGHGLVFNPGQAVLGTTTPLYSAILAVLSVPFGGANAPFPEIAWILNALIAAACCLLLIKLGSLLGSQSAGYATALVWAVAPMPVTFAIGGMETSLTIALVVAAFYLYHKDRPTAGALAASLSLLARPDALLFVGPLGVERVRQLFSGEASWREDLRGLGREVLAFAFPVAAWGIFAWATYGSPLTNSVSAKSQAYRLPADAALIRLLQHYATPFFGQETFGIPWIGVGLFLFPVLFGLGTIFSLRSQPSAWPLFASVWLYFAVFAAANPLIFRWYLAPPLPFYFLGIFLGGRRLSRDLGNPAPMVLLASLAMLLTLRAWTLQPDHGPSRPAPKMAYIELELLYEDIARDLKEDIGPAETLGAADIGALGYVTGARVLDTLGLISPKAMTYYPADPKYYVINYAIPPELIEKLQPDYLVILEVYGRSSLLVDPQFVRDYRLERTVPTDIYGSNGMLIFSRVRR